MIVDHFSLLHQFANIWPSKAHVSLQVEARESKTKKMELIAGSIRSVRALLSQQLCYVFCKTSTKYEHLAFSQEDIGHLCSVIPAVEELLLDGVGTKDQK